jgi:DNA primase
LVICSSLKDGMAFMKLGFKNAEFIAPDSENIMLADSVIVELKQKYQGITTLFDNDEAGIKAMIKYKEQFDIPSTHLKIEKDLADCIKVHNLPSTREFLYPILTKSLTGTSKQLSI